METITQLFAAEQLRTMTCGPEQGLIKNWQNSLKQQQTAGMPAHEVDVSKPPEQDGMAEAMRNVFLHQAAGGPKEGFTTKNPRSHAVAQSLAKTGHLKKVGEFKHANNQTVHHWQLTEKGLASAQTGGQGGFPVSYPKQAGGMAVPTKSPGDPSKGMPQAAPGATGKNGIGQPDPKQKFKVAAGGPGSGRHPGPGARTESKLYTGLKKGEYTVKHPVKWSERGERGTAHVKVNFSVGHDGTMGRMSWPDMKEVARAAGRKSVGAVETPEMHEVASRIRSGQGKPRSGQ